jgi:hypothetical protein
MTRTAHGRARELGRLTASECPPADELKPGRGSEPGRPRRTAQGQFAPGNDGFALEQRGVPKGGLVGLSRRAKDPAWLAARRLGKQAATRRIAEVARAHGGELSSGVCRMLRSAAELDADATYLRARAAADDNPDLLRTAAQLSAGARQSERDAWALADLEARSRPRPKAPWELAIEAAHASAPPNQPAPPATKETP